MLDPSVVMTQVQDLLNRSLEASQRQADGAAPELALSVAVEHLAQAIDHLATAIARAAPPAGG